MISYDFWEDYNRTLRGTILYKTIPNKVQEFQTYKHHSYCVENEHTHKHTYYS